MPHGPHCCLLSQQSSTIFKMTDFSAVRLTLPSILRAHCVHFHPQLFGKILWKVIPFSICLIGCSFHSGKYSWIFGEIKVSAILFVLEMKFNKEFSLASYVSLLACLTNDM